MKRTIAAIAAVTSVLALAGTAAAHVRLLPNALPSGGFTVVNVRVPNELVKAATVKVDVQFPSGILFVQWAGVNGGWSAHVYYRKLDKPVKAFGEQLTSEVDHVVFSGGRVQPNQFAQFPILLSVPAARAGTVLTFKAVQTYSNGEVVRWIGVPTSDTPAPQVMVTPADSAVAEYPGGIPAIRKSRSTSGRAPLLGLVLGVPALGAGGLLLARRRRQAS